MIMIWMIRRIRNVLIMIMKSMMSTLVKESTFMEAKPFHLEWIKDFAENDAWCDGRKELERRGGQRGKRNRGGERGK